MFAFIFFDSKKNKLIAARDEFGQKPLYYHKNTDGLTISSNIQSIKNLANLKEINYQSLKMYLSTQSSLIFA